jgi:Protein of unknown function (DUF1185).
VANQLIELLGGADQIQSYGKGSIVGEAGELEHGALWHVPGGYAMREALGGAPGPSCLLPKKSVASAVGWIFPLHTSMPLMCAVILMLWKFMCKTHPEQMKLFMD